NISETNIDKLEDNIDAFLNVIGLENPEMLSSIRFNYITLEEVAFTSYFHEIEIGEILAKIEIFKCLGFDIPTLDKSNDVGNQKVSDKGIICLLSENWEGESPAYNEELKVCDIILASHKLNIGIEEVFSKLSPLTALGLKLPLSQRSYLNNISISSDDEFMFLEKILSWERLYENRPREAFKKIILQDFITSSKELEKSIGELIYIWKKFEYTNSSKEIVENLVSQITIFHQSIMDRVDIIASDLLLNHASGNNEIYPYMIFARIYEEDLEIDDFLSRLKRFAFIFKVSLPNGKPENWLTYADVVSQ
ncbi:MAG: hypothetical protein F6K11_18395, partial [Leptolyngbya sp. SIO3F4]|nr:hypothetical protein [Leptolyngbya sp. SIO3F4]